MDRNEELREESRRAAELGRQDDDLAPRAVDRVPDLPRDVEVTRERGIGMLSSNADWRDVRHQDAEEFARTRARQLARENAEEAREADRARETNEGTEAGSSRAEVEREVRLDAETPGMGDRPEPLVERDHDLADRDIGTIPGAAAQIGSQGLASYADPLAPEDTQDLHGVPRDMEREIVQPDDFRGNASGLDAEGRPTASENTPNQEPEWMEQPMDQGGFGAHIKGGTADKAWDEGSRGEGQGEKREN